jgi:hypothetical protein
MESTVQHALDALAAAIATTQRSPGAHVYDTFNQALMTAASAVDDAYAYQVAVGAMDGVTKDSRSALPKLDHKISVGDLLRIVVHAQDYLAAQDWLGDYFAQRNPTRV